MKFKTGDIVKITIKTEKQENRFSRKNLFIGKVGYVQQIETNPRWAEYPYHVVSLNKEHSAWFKEDELSLAEDLTELEKEFYGIDIK